MMGAMGGEKRALTAMWTIALLFAILAAAGFAALDDILGDRLAAAGPQSFWHRGVALLDAATLRALGSWLLPSILLFAGIILLPLRATRGTGFPLVYVGAVHLLCAGIAEVAAPLSGRLRPSEMAGGSDLWLSAGDSFPSVDTAFYAGLFLPLIMLFPRAAPLWLAPPLFVAAAGVMLDRYHFSDVAAPLAFAALLSGGLAFVAEKGKER